MKVSQVFSSKTKIQRFVISLSKSAAKIHIIPDMAKKTLPPQENLQWQSVLLLYQGGLYFYEFFIKPVKSDQFSTL